MSQKKPTKSTAWPDKLVPRPDMSQAPDKSRNKTDWDGMRRIKTEKGDRPRDPSAWREEVLE